MMPHITLFYLQPDISEHTPPWPQPVRLVLDLPVADPYGWGGHRGHVTL